jgi:hypothetical protein
MSYNEWKYSKTHPSTTTNSEVYKNLARKYLTPEDFIKVYSNAFLDFIDGTLNRKNESHIEDIVIQNTTFAEAFFHIIVALDSLEK